MGRIIVARACIKIWWPFNWFELVTLEME